MAIGLLAAVLFRVFIWVGRLGALDTDEAVSGLMARHILQGEFPVFYWGQNYGGTGETYLTAGLFALIDSSTAALRAIPVALFAASAFVIWRTGKRIVGEPGASIAAVLFLVWPAFLVFKSTLGHGYYGLLTLIATTALFLAFRIQEERTLPRYALLGAALGLGLWTSPQIVLVGLPIVVWLLAQRATRQWTGLMVAAGSALIGSAPWLIWNAMNDWSSLRGIPGLPASTYLGRLQGLIARVIPSGLGLRVPGGDWLFPSWFGWICCIALVGAFIWFLVTTVREKDPRRWLLGLIAVMFPWLYALSPHAWFDAEPRYMLLLFPVICLVVGYGFNRSYAVRLFTVSLAIPLTGWGLIGMNTLFETAPDFTVNTRSTRLTQVIDVLRENDQRFVIADFWVAYPITFETREEIIATSYGHVRYTPHDEVVRSQPHPAYVFITGTGDQEAFERDLPVNYPGYEPVLQNEYTVYVYDE